MEILIDIGKDDLSALKKSITNTKIDSADRSILKNILDKGQCKVDELPILERAMLLIDNDRDNNRFRLHEFLQRSKVQLPSLPKEERSAVLEARCQRLREQQANREYRDMTRNVDTQIAKESPLSEIGREIRSINRHLITLFNMLFTVIGSFVFAYMATSYMYPGDDGAAFASRLGAGLVTGTVVFFADLYFVIRTLDEEAYETKKAK